MKDSTGEGALAIISKQCASIGMPSWDSAVGSGEVRGYTFCTDGGPDQRKARRLIKAKVRTIPCVYFFDTDCFSHQGHILDGAVLSFLNLLMLSLCAGVSFAGSVAMLMNVWRSHAKSFFTCWAGAFSKADAAKHAQKVPEKALASRWGSYYSCTKRLLAMPTEKFRTVYTAITDKRIRKASSASSSLAGDLDFVMTLDELGKTASKEFQATMGKWCRLSLKAVQSSEFWMVMRLHGKLSTIINRFHSFLKKHDQLVIETGVGALASLVFGKAQVPKN